MQFYFYIKASVVKSSHAIALLSLKRTPSLTQHLFTKVDWVKTLTLMLNINRSWSNEPRQLQFVRLSSKAEKLDNLKTAHHLRIQF